MTSGFVEGMKLVVLSKEFNTLKKSLGNVNTFAALDTVEFLMPFLDVIRSEVKKLRNA